MSKRNLSKKMWTRFMQEASKKNLCSNEFKAMNMIPKTLGIKTALSIGESLLGYWDSLVRDGWGSLNARTLKSRYSNGKIRHGFKRTWLCPAPSSSNIKIVVNKRAGTGAVKKTAAGTVTIEKYNENGSVIERKILSFPSGKTAINKSATMSDDKFGFILVTVDTKNKILNFPYSIKYQEIPKRVSTRKVRGFADIHVHQTAEYAFAGNWLHGSMMGAASSVLKPCTKRYHDYKLVNFSIKDLSKYKADEKGLTASYRTHGSGYPSFKNWPHHLDISHQQVHENWLKRAFQNGLKLMVSSCVNSEVLSLVLGAAWDKDEWRDMNCLKKQINKIHQFAARNKSWAEVAYNPWHAREIIANNKLAILIAVESSNIFPLDAGHWEAQLDELYCMGVRSVQIVHHCDNRYAGAAPQERGIVGIQSISRLTRASLHKSRRNIADDGFFGKDKPLGFDFDRAGNNIRGLSKVGEKLVNGLMDRHMLVDTAHYSRRTFNDVYEIARKRKYYPLFVSHTKFKSILSTKQKDVQREFLTSDDQIVKLNKTGGMVGLRTAPWSDTQGCCGPRSSAQPDDKGTIGTSRNYAQQIAYASQKKIQFAIGSDFNGFTNQLGPRRKDGARPAGISHNYWTKGLNHIGALPDLVKDLKVLRTPGASQLDSSAENFIKMWERCWDNNRRMVRR